MFSKVEGANAVVLKGGVYKHVDVYTFQGGLFVAYSGGYARVYARGSTSVDKLGVNYLVYDEDLFQDQHGRLCVAAGEGRKKVALAPPDQMTASKLCLPSS